MLQHRMIKSEARHARFVLHEDYIRDAHLDRGRCVRVQPEAGFDDNEAANAQQRSYCVRSAAAQQTCQERRAEQHL